MQGKKAEKDKKKCQRLKQHFNFDNHSHFLHAGLHISFESLCTFVLGQGEWDQGTQSPS